MAQPSHIHQQPQHPQHMQQHMQHPGMPQFPPQQMMPRQTDGSASTTHVITGTDLQNLLNQPSTGTGGGGEVRKVEDDCPKLKWGVYGFGAGMVTGAILYYIFTKKQDLVAESMAKVTETAAEISAPKP